MRWWFIGVPWILLLLHVHYGCRDLNTSQKFWIWVSTIHNLAVLGTAIGGQWHRVMAVGCFGLLHSTAFGTAVLNCSVGSVLFLSPMAAYIANKLSRLIVTWISLQYSPGTSEQLLFFNSMTGTKEDEQILSRWLHQLSFLIAHVVMCIFPPWFTFVDNSLHWIYGSNVHNLIPDSFLS